MMYRNAKKWWSLPVALLVTVGLGTAHAQEFGPYQLEAGLEYEASSNGTDMTLIGVGGFWHFQEVFGGTEPLAERAFLGHVPLAGLQVGQMEWDLGGGTDSDGLVFGAEGRYAGKKNELPVTASASFLTGTLDGDDPFFGPFDLDITQLEARAGYWVQPNLEAGVLFGIDTFEFTDSSGSFEFENTIFGVYGKTVREMGGKFVNLEAEIRSIDGKATGSPSETNIEIEVGGDYYIDIGIGVGGAITINSGDDSFVEGTTIELRGRYDYGTQFGAELSFVNFLASDTNVEDETTIAFRVVYRR